MASVIKKIKMTKPRWTVHSCVNLSPSLTLLTFCFQGRWANTTRETCWLESLKCPRQRPELAPCKNISLCFGTIEILTLESTPLAIRDIKTKICCFALARVVIVFAKRDIVKHLWGREETGTLVLCRWECWRVRTPWKVCRHCVSNLNPWLLPDPAIPLMGVPNRSKNVWFHKDLETNAPRTMISTAATWKQAKCPSAGERTHRMPSTPLIRWYLSVRGKSYADEPHDLKDPQERSSRWKEPVAEAHMISFIQIVQKREICRDRK